MTTLRECFEIWRAKALREPSCLQLLKAAVHCLRKEKLLARNVFDHIYYAMQSSRLQQVKAVSHLELHTMSKSLKAILNYVVKLRRFRVSLANVYYKQLLFDHFQALKQFHMICQRRIEDCRHQLRQNRKRNTLHFMAAHAAKRISQKRQSKLGDKDQETVFRMPYELTPSKDPVVQALNLRSASLLEPRNTITLLDSTARRRFTPITTVPSLPVVVMPSRENLQAASQLSSDSITVTPLNPKQQLGSSRKQPSNCQDQLAWITLLKATELEILRGKCENSQLERYIRMCQNTLLKII